MELTRSSRISPYLPRGQHHLDNGARGSDTLPRIGRQVDAMRAITQRIQRLDTQCLAIEKYHLAVCRRAHSIVVR